MTELAALFNPFRDTVVKDAWQVPTDVPEIHNDVFQACLAGIESAARAVSDSLLVFGPAGSGKTHLLTRLQRHLVETAEDAPDRVLRCVFVFVRLQTSPRLIWQHVRRRLATDLMRRDQGVTQLQRLIAHQMRTRGGASPRARVMELRVLSQADNEALMAHLSEVVRDLALPHDLCRVLEHLVCGRLVRDAFAWLAGDSLPDAVLATLGVGSDPDDDREEVARELVTALCRLARETLPIVFCFDQVEALQRGLEDKDAFFRFGRMAADLCDADPNVFSITCLQSAVVESFRASIREADRDRMARREIVLEPLSPSQVHRLVCSRLDLVPEIAPSRKRRQLYPFTSAFVDELAAKAPCVPRRVLTAAAQRFEELQHGRSPALVSRPEFLRQKYQARAAEAAHTCEPADTSRILLQGLEPLAAVGGIEVTDCELGTADFAIRADRTILVEVRNEADGRSLGPHLKRLLENTPRKDGARTVLVRDPRLPVSKQAIRTRERLQQLSARGIPLVKPTVEALAALAALSEILADAKSGDLAHDGEAIPGNAVLQWLRGLRQDLSVEPVEQLVSSLLTEPDVPADATEQDLAELVSRARVLEVDAAAAELGVSAKRLLDIAQKDPDRFLVLRGPPEVVVDVAGVAAQGEG